MSGEDVYDCSERDKEKEMFHLLVEDCDIAEDDIFQQL